MIAVTASSGRLGSAILQRLVPRAGAANVVSVARQPERISLAGIEKRAGCYTSIAGMTAALAGVDTVLMISAPVATGTDRVRMHRNVIAAAKAAGARRVLFTSVIGNGREAGTMFESNQQINRQAEADLKDSGLAWAVGRSGLYLDLDLVHIRRAAAGDGCYANSAGDGRAPYISIAEIAEAWVDLAIDDRHVGRTYNVVGERVTQAELVAAAAEVLGLNVRYQVISDEKCLEKFRELMAARGEAVARMLTGCFQCIRNGAFDVPSDFSAITGRPARSLRQMLAEC